MKIVKNTNIFPGGRLTKYCKDRYINPKIPGWFDTLRGNY